MENKMNLTMLTDFYELTMANGYFETGMADNIAYFDMFFRRVPDGGGYAIMAGVEQLMAYLKNLKFTDEDIEFLRSKGIFCDDFLEYLEYSLVLYDDQPDKSYSSSYEKIGFSPLFLSIN